MLDFAGIRAEARADAAGAFDAWAALLSEHPGARSLQDLLNDGLPSADAKRVHLLQSAVQAVAKAAATQTHPHFTFSVLLADPVTHFGSSRDAYLQANVDSAFATYAYLTLDGRWCSPDSIDDDTVDHVHAMAAYVDSLPDETVLVSVLCHQ